MTKERRRVLRSWEKTGTDLPIMRCAVLVVLLCSTVACSGRLSEPSGLGDPVGPVLFKLHNGTSSAVYVPWRETVPGYDIQQNGKHLDTIHWCTPLCEQGCVCVDCNPMPQAVRRVGAAETYTFAWSGVWYEPVSCTGGCGCDETRSTVGGKYEITVAGARGYKPEGASAPVEQEQVVSKATLDLTQGACEAQKTASLVAGAQTIELELTCEK